MANRFDGFNFGNVGSAASGSAVKNSVYVSKKTTEYLNFLRDDEDKALLLESISQAVDGMTAKANAMIEQGSKAGITFPQKDKDGKSYNSLRAKVEYIVARGKDNKAKKTPTGELLYSRSITFYSEDGVLDFRTSPNGKYLQGVSFSRFGADRNLIERVSDGELLTSKAPDYIKSFVTLFRGEIYSLNPEIHNLKKAIDEQLKDVEKVEIPCIDADTGEEFTQEMPLVYTKYVANYGQLVIRNAYLENHEIQVQANEKGLFFNDVTYNPTDENGNPKLDEQGNVIKVERKPVKTLEEAGELSQLYGDLIAGIVVDIKSAYMEHRGQQPKRGDDPR